MNRRHDRDRTYRFYFVGTAGLLCEFCKLATVNLNYVKMPSLERISIYNISNTILNG